MQTSERAELAKAIVVAAEVMGHDISPNAAKAMATELVNYETVDVLNALRRCQREVTGRLSLASVIARIDDGHLGPDQAWALCPRGEADTVVWTDEMRQAFGVAAPLLAEGDKVAARMAFRDAYTKLVQQARDGLQKARWEVSLGHDAAGREHPVRDAIAMGRLPADSAALYLPPVTTARRLESGETMSPSSIAVEIKKLPMMNRAPRVAALAPGDDSDKGDDMRRSATP